MKKQNIMPVVVLTVICLIAALLMGVVNMICAPIIEAAQLEASNAALKVVLPDGKNFKEEALKTGFPEEITKAYSAEGGYVFESSVSGNKPGIIVMCGISADGKVVGVEVIKNDETPSYWSKVYPLVAGTDGVYSGKNNSDISAELVSGATKSSTALYQAVKASLNAYAVMTGGEVDDSEEVEPEAPKAPETGRTEAEVLELAKAMYDGDVTLVEYEVENPDITTLKVFRNESDGTFVFHIATRTEWVANETEALFLTDDRGTVLDVNLLNWTVGHGVNYTPEYVNSFIGTNKYFTYEVELVTDATGTSKNLLNALESALISVFANISLTDAEILKLAESVTPEGKELEAVALENAPEAVKAMFKLSDDSGYVFYTVTSTQYVARETEAFVYINAAGKIQTMRLVNWTVGHGVYPTKEFVDGFIGKSEATIGGVEIVSGATGTSDNLKNAIKDALSLVPVSFLKTDEEIKDIAAELLPKSTALTKLEISKELPAALKAMFKYGGGYVFYTVTSTQYVDVETEAVICTDSNGRITGIKLLTWTVGHGVNYTPEYINSFIGKNRFSVNDAELVTEATGTSLNLVNAIDGVLEVLFADIPMSKEDVLYFAEKVAPEGEKLIRLNFIKNTTPKTVRALFKLASGRGYVAYTVTSTQYVKYETEAFIYMDINGRVKNIILPTWTVGHGVEPTDDFINSFIGETPETIDSVELITGCTGTSGNLRGAVKDAMSVVPEHTNYAVIAAISVAFVVGAVLAYTVTKVIIRRKKR